MTRSHRRLHLMAWAVLGPLALLGLLAGLIGRPAIPIQNSNDAGTRSAVPAFVPPGEGQR